MGDGVNRSRLTPNKSERAALPACRLGAPGLLVRVPEGQLAPWRRRRK